jgi:predicted DNA-binding protein (UPF0251 family)
MPRPYKNRFISGQPGSVVYKPAGIPAKSLEWIYLGLDEFEAIHLLDYKGLEQNKVAELMKVSRPTVTRIYANARRKIATALTEGKAICIEGGPVFEQKPQCRGFGRRGGRHRRRGGRGR